MRGTYKERAIDTHVAAREAFFTKASSVPLLAINCERRLAERQLGISAKLSLQRDGYFLADVGNCSSPDLIDIATSFGEPTELGKNSVPGTVEEGAIFNLLIDPGVDPGNLDLRLISDEYLAFHSESSKKERGKQPQYVLLYCVQPGWGDTAATIVCDMDAVAGRLDADDLDVLSVMRYSFLSSLTPMAYRVDDRWSFSFRDFMGDGFSWECPIVNSEARGNAAIRSLLLSMYSLPSAIFRTSWRAGQLLILDNHRFFHGRGRSQRAGWAPRHIKRILIR
jgi:hypothetical protein